CASAPGNYFDFW
nr:immunoglobulin heavy chain junction region [Mus musculus]